MNASDLLLEQWSQQVKELFPNLHRYQQETLAFVVQGIIQSGNAVMQRVAESAWEYLSSEVKIISHERRFQRFVDNERIEVDTCWSHFLQQILSYWDHKPMTLILDLTPYTDESTIVYVGLLVQSRVLPLGWQVMPQQEQWEQGQWELVRQLFDQIASHLSGPSCTLLADRGLTCLTLIKLCKQFGWHYVLRIKNEEWFRKQFRHFYRDWQQGKQMVKKEGEQWYGKVLLWQEHSLEIWLSACWEEGYEEAWFLISDLCASIKRVREYAKRMKVESTFQDQKSRGCLIECSRFTNRDHLHRWLFGLSGDVVVRTFGRKLSASWTSRASRSQRSTRQRTLTHWPFMAQSHSQAGQSRSCSQDPRSDQGATDSLPALFASKPSPVFLYLPVLIILLSRTKFLSGREPRSGGKCPTKYLRLRAKAAPSCCLPSSSR